MGWREYNERCGPDCVATICCKTASQAAASFCGCGGGYDHADCPPVDDDDDDEELRRYAEAGLRIAQDSLGADEVLANVAKPLSERVEVAVGGAWVTLEVWVAEADLGGE